MYLSDRLTCSWSAWRLVAVPKVFRKMVICPHSPSGLVVNVSVFFSTATEIQNIQIGEGNVPTGISIPIYMVFPRLFSCSTTKTANFKIGELW